MFSLHKLYSTKNTLGLIVNYLFRTYTNSDVEKLLPCNLTKLNGYPF